MGLGSASAASFWCQPLVRPSARTAATSGTRATPAHTPQPPQSPTRSTSARRVRATTATKFKITNGSKSCYSDVRLLVGDLRSACSNGHN